MDQAIDFERLKRSIDAGAAVCLLGAGFSTQALDSSGNKKVPTTLELTDELKDLLGIPSEENMSLSDVAELAEESLSDRTKLNQHLVRRLTGTTPSNCQNWLLNLNWRSVFTTNFDDVVEQSQPSIGRIPITPASDISTIPPSKIPIYYLHGRALDLREKDENPSLVISESNYLNLDKKNRNLYARLFNEIACARVVVLIGYSLRDLEIAAKILKMSESSRDKTFIVTGPNDSEFAIRRLKKFGQIIPIGLEGLSEKLKNIPPATGQVSSIQYMTEFSLNGPGEQDSDSAVSGDDFIQSVLSGRIDPDKFASQNIDGDFPYCVERRVGIEAVIGGTQQRYVVSGDFGNGKTAFLQQLAVRLFSAGYRVFFVETTLNEVFPEIDIALRTGEPVAFLVDDVIRLRKVAGYIGTRIHNQAILVCTTRGDQDAQYEQLAAEIGGGHRFIDLNRLDDSEIDDWNHLLERWGYWELRSELDVDARRKFIAEDCGRENRSIILSLFEQSRVSEKIDGIVSFFMKRNGHHIEAFCGLLISSLAQRHVSWDSIVNWLDIDDEKLRKDISQDEISFLFKGRRDWNFLTSAQLAEYILRRKFVDDERDVLVKIFSKIVLSTADSADDSRSGFDYGQNLKELMKFRFLEKLFGENDAGAVLIGRVYRRLSDAPRIRNNPQFWLQYAMSKMKIGDLDNAESFINTALGKANERGMEYNPFQILDQRARLYIRKNTLSTKNLSISEISTAITDLSDLAKNQSYDIVYTLRSLPLIEDLLEAKVDSFNPDLRAKLASFLGLLKEKSSGFERLPRSQRGETKVLRNAMRNVELILFNA